MENNIFVDKVLREKKITDYLAKNGIFPVRESADKKMYICPIHDGDTTPSFAVFTGGEYEKYYCFGCHSGVSIVNLIADMRKISHKEAFKMLTKGVDFSSSDSLDAFIDNFHDFVEQGEYIDIISAANIEQLLMKISVMCYDFIDLHTELDENEISFFENVWKKIDKVASMKDRKMVEKIYHFLAEYGLPQRAQKIMQINNEKQLQIEKDILQWEEM